MLLPAAFQDPGPPGRLGSIPYSDVWWERI